MTPAFNPVIHAPHRLQICAMLAPLGEIEFSVVREGLGVSDSVLSKQARVLEEAGYLTISKATVETRQRTWLAFTPAGRDAFKAHMAELQRLANLAGV
ncbi:transcriptional regulator [Maricaulis sp.]|uniref:transcriptional regulator n=1 Tax=Maricaulis sp. TaxID=1486257 RepID=UPI003A93B9ED